jgi:hypothetical protein
MHDGALSLWWCLRYYFIWNQHRALVPCIYHHCLFPGLFQATLQAVQTSHSLSLSHSLLNVYATSWSLVHDEASRDMSCIEAPYVFLNALMLWAPKKILHTHIKLTQMLTFQGPRIPTNLVLSWIFFPSPEKLALKYLWFHHQPRFNPVSRYLIPRSFEENLIYLILDFLLP